MLDPHRLAVLREFAARGTIARTADALAFTPSAVSQQLAQLQREAGVELLRKTGRRLELTDAGRRLVDRAGELLAHAEAIEAELAAEAGAVRGIVRVASFQTAALALVAPVLGRLRRDHPDLRVELHEAEAEESLPLVARGALEIAVAEEYEHAPRPRVAALHRHELEPDALVLALPRRHPAAQDGGPVRLGALRGEAWATTREGTAYADMVLRMCRSAGRFEPDIRHRASDLRLLLDLVARDGVVTVVPTLGRPERDRRVAVRPVAGRRFARRIFAAVRASDRDRPATAAVVAAIAGARR